MSDLDGNNFTHRILGRSQSFSKDAFLTTDYANDGIAAGFAFEVATRIAIPGNDTADVWINYSAYDDLTPIRVGDPDRIGVVVILPPYFSATAGPVYIDVYRDPMVTAETGTDIRTIRKNTTVNNHPQVEWILNPTVTDLGSAPFQYLVGTQGQGNISGGGDSISGAPFFRDNTSSTLVRISNQNSSDIQFYYSQVWYEI